MAYALDEIVRVDGPAAARAGNHPGRRRLPRPSDGRIDLDAVPHDDETTYRLIRTTRTLGCFQIESPGQRELVGKFGPESFADLIIDISLFRPGPVKSDMVTPFLRARQGWDAPEYLHPSLERGARRDLRGGGLPRAGAADRRRPPPAAPWPRPTRSAGRWAPRPGRSEVEDWWRPRAAGRDYDPADGRADLGGAEGVRLVRVLQGARRGVRAAHLPVGLAQGPPPGGVPGRGAHPRPRDVPQAADPRRRPQPRHRRAAAGRQRLRRRYRVERVEPARVPDDQDDPHPHDPAPDAPHVRRRPGRPAGAAARSRPARRPRLRHPAVPGRGEGITEAEVARIVAGRPYHAWPTSGTGPRSPARWSSAWC